MNSRELLRRQLDARLRELPREQPPKGGWIRTIRTALGMTMGQLGKRIGVSAPGVARLESRDSSESISVARLRSAAEALGCDLLIAFVPRTPLTDMVQQQAALKAMQENSRLIHTMKLEDQDQGVAQPEDLARSIDKWIARRGARLWD